MILTREQMKILIREGATRIRREMELERFAQKKVEELKERRREIMALLNGLDEEKPKQG